MTSTILRRTTVKRAVLIISIIIVIAFFFPFDRTVVPPWRFQVIDERGHPLTNTPVRQIWRHYSAENDEHMEDSITDQNGFGQFPRRTIRVSQFQIIRGTISNFLKYSIHASYGPSSYIIVLAGDDFFTDPKASHTRSGPLPERITVLPLHKK